MNSTANLLRWQSHKCVWADKIERIIDRYDDPRRPASESRWVWELRGGTRIVVDPALIARGTPVVGDYYVRYDDGYESWSPKKAFEEGYTLVPLGAEAP